jgi:predicted Zn finger-like uncharacterized protein
MPQYDMKIVDAADVEGREVGAHVAGKPFREGGGDETYRCGMCKTKLLVNVAHQDAHGAVVKCGKCGRINMEVHERHHHW